MSEAKKVQIRNGFSDRNKIQPLNTEIQLHELDERTRNALANLIQEWYTFKLFEKFKEPFCEILVKRAYGEYLSDDLKRQIKYNNENIFDLYIHRTIEEKGYSEVLTLVEYVTNVFITWRDDILKNPFDYTPYGPFSGITKSRFPEYENELNDLFEKEFVGYRFIAEQIVPISDPLEIKTIEQSLTIKYDGPKSHISKALGFLADRVNPDYKNSIKESVSAMESICGIFIGDVKGTLGKNVRKLNGVGGFRLHEALITSISNLYGYASDVGGVRHGEGPSLSNVSFEEAKYILVCCSAFVNFLIAEDAKNEN